MDFGALTYDQIIERDPKAFDRIREQNDINERREAWLALRRGRLTASGVSKLFTSKLAPSNAKTATQYIYEKVSERLGSQIPRSSSAATQWGNDQEPYAVIAYMNRTKNEVKNWGDGRAFEANGETYQSDGQQFVLMGDYYGATPDGIVLPRKTLQVKCPYNPGIHAMYLRITTPDRFKELLPDYYCQVQFEMMVCREEVSKEIESCEFVSYDPRMPGDHQLKILTIPIDEPFQDALKARLEDATKEIQEALVELA